jgi:hypothetical protein
MVLLKGCCQTAAHGDAKALLDLTERQNANVQRQQPGASIPFAKATD